MTRMFILSHVRLVREALALSLSRRQDIEVVGVGEPSPAIVEELQKARTDVALLDMSQSNAARTAKCFVGLSPTVKVVAFSVGETNSEVLACAESGIAGFVSQNGTIEDLVAAAENAMRGELYCSPRIAALLFGHVAQLGARVPSEVDAPLLTRREQEISGFIVQGLSNKAIAKELRIGTATVKNHVHSILDKLHVRRRGEAAARLRGPGP